MRTQKRADAREQYFGLEASGADYLLFAAASAVPFYTSGMLIQQPRIGMFFVAVGWAGLLFSYLVRTLVKASWTRHSGWLQLAVAVFIAFNFRSLNSSLPEGGFEWQLAPAAFLCWLLAIGSYFLWSDGAMLFQVVPGVALFGIQSWIETAGYYEISLVLFMASVAVLLTRLHLRLMYATARAAGAGSQADLYAGPWKAVAGPVLAIVSVLAVAGFSWFAAPIVGGAARTIAGSPTLNLRPPSFARNLLSNERVQRRIGNGPITASNLPVLRATSKARPRYLRKFAYVNYRGIGWTESSRVERVEPSNEPPISRLPNVKVYEFPTPPDVKGDQISMLLESVNRRHSYVYSPGVPVRLEYDGDGVSVDRGQFPIVEDDFPSGRKYVVNAIQVEPSEAELRDAQTNRAAFLRNYGGRDIIDKEVRELSQSIASGSPSDYETIQRFIREIAKRCKYNLKAERITGERDRVAAFLFDTNEGYCDLFASALAVMCRAVGIPSRVIIGYRLDPEGLEGDTYTVRDKDAHMWTQVYFEDYGWVDFDATAAADAVPGAGVGDVLEADQGLTMKWAAWAAGIVFGLTFLALLGGSVLSWFRQTKGLSPDARRLRPLYLRFLRLLRKGAARPKGLAETTREYANAYRLARGNGRLATDLAEAFDRALYSPEPPGQAELADIRSRLQELAAANSKNGH